MAYDEKHMDTARRLARHQAEREWLRVAYETLERQTTVLKALQEALFVTIGEDGEGRAEGRRLELLAARTVLAQCESIMRHSGLDTDALAEIATAPGGDRAEAREETLPW